MVPKWCRNVAHRAYSTTQWTVAVHAPCELSFVSCSTLCSLFLLSQDNGLKYLHYADSPAKFDIRNGTEDLPERIEIASVSQISTGTCAPPPNIVRDHPDLSATLSPSPLSFSLLSASGESLADQIANDQSRWADWTDGLNMLRRDSGHVASEETAGYIKALTEIGLKIKLLGTSVPALPSSGTEVCIADLSGEKVDIPSGLVGGGPPNNTDFFFSDLL